MVFQNLFIQKKKNYNKIPFFHLGPNNNWQINFDSSFTNELNKNFKESLQELGYN